MKSLFKLTKTKLIALLLACSTMAIAAGGSIAFFTDSKQMEGVFTAGNVYIELSEAAVKADAAGHLVEDTESERIKGADMDSENPVVNNYGRIFPGQKIHKDPTIKNVGDDAAWIAAKIILTDGAGDINNLFGYDGFDEIDIEMLLSGGLLAGTTYVGEWNGIDNVCYNQNYAMVQVANRAMGVYEFYFFMLNPLEKNAEVELFDTLSVHPLFGNAEMREFAELNITVQAFAVQTFGFSDCYGAMREAFATQFENCGAY